MDMGTGKTLTALKLFDIRRKAGKVDKLIILCPISGKRNTIAETEKHTYFVYGRDYEIFGIDSISQSDRIYLEALYSINSRTMLVLDESTYIKNPYAIRSKRALELSKKTDYKLIMTGTPITKFVNDLWAQITFLSPLIFGYKSYHSFANNHLIFHKEKGYIIRSANVDYLTQKLSPYIYEKKIEEVIDMPEQSYNLKYYFLSQKKREEYELLKDKILGEWLLEDASDQIIYRLFTELQKLVSYDPDRLNILVDIIRELNPEQQAIIWTKYHKERDYIIDYLKSQGESFSIFDGKHKQEDAFKQKRTRFLVANLQTGSRMQNFQNSHYQIFYSNSFDYDIRIQAERRTWRAGQKHKCIYYDIQSNTGIENLIFYSLRKKSNLLRDFQDLSRRFNKKYLEEYLRKELAINDTDRSEFESKAM